jgi:hypothetical protein
MKKRTTFLGSVVFLLAGLCALSAIHAQTGGAIWEDGPDMNKTRIFPYVAQLDDDRNIAFGGRELGFISSLYADAFDPVDMEFKEYTMLTPRDFPGIAPLADGRFFICGGSDNLGVAPGYTTIEYFNPADNSFELGGNMFYGRMQHAAVQLSGGNVLIVGGWYSPDAAAYPEVFNTEGGIPLVTGSMNTPRSGPLVLPTNDGGAVVIGGWPTYGGDMFTQVEYYNAVANTFEVFGEDILPSDPGWLAYGSTEYRPYTEKMMYDGRYIFKVHRKDAFGDLEYGLMTFDPATKLFEMLPLSGSLMGDDISSYYDMVLNTDGTMAYLLSAYIDANPYGMKVVSVDLVTGEVYIPDDYYQLPLSNYFMGTLSWIPSEEKILLIGISTSPSDYFNATNKTMVLTPEMKTTSVEEAPFTQVNLYPNPAQDRVTIDGLPSVDFVTLTDIQGRNIELRVFEQGHNSCWFDVSGLPSGIYLLRVGDNIQKKLVIQHRSFI